MQSAARAGQTDKDGNILLIIQLGGGNDGLNTVIPYTNDAYYENRPTLAVKKTDVLTLNDTLALHPILKGFKALYDDGLLTIINGVGYPNPSRSHFQSMRYWHAGMIDKKKKVLSDSGWIGKVFDHTCGNQHLKNKAIKPSTTWLLSIGNQLNPSFKNNSYGGMALEDPKLFSQMVKFYQSSIIYPPLDSGNEELDFLTRTSMNTTLVSDRILKCSQNVKNQLAYPETKFAQGLALIARLIAGGMDTQVYYISLGGFDTHARQKERHENLLRILDDGISSFQKDLIKLGQAERVLGFTFSEFGRRVKENGSEGTDHGKAAPLFFFGKAIKPGVIGEYPSLTKLSRGDLQFHTDFRQLYATVINQWLDVDSQLILGKKFAQLPLLN